MLNKFFWAAILWTVFVTVLCLVNSSSISRMDVVHLPDTDKIVHFIFYFVFTLLWYLSFKNVYTSHKLRLYIFLLAVAYGGMIEIVQLLFTSGRSADVMDALANTAGSAAAITILWLLKKIKN